jgi:hypothetical protein
MACDRIARHQRFLSRPACLFKESESERSHASHEAVARDTVPNRPSLRRRGRALAAGGPTIDDDVGLSYPVFIHSSCV